MSVFNDLREKRIERKKVLDAAGAILSKATKEKRSLTRDENQEFDRRHDDGDRLMSEIQRLERQHDATVSLAAPVRDNRSGGMEDITHSVQGERSTRTVEGLSDEQRNLTTRWLLGGTTGLSQEEQRACMRGINPDEVRAMSAVTGASGAYSVPTGFVFTLDAALKYYGGIVDTAAYIDTDNGILMPYPSVNDTSNTAEVIPENTAVAGATTGEVDPSYGIINLSAYMFDSKVIKVPIQLLQDSAFDVEGYLNEQLGTRIGRQLNTLCTVGTGTNQPTGIVPASPLGTTGSLPTNILYTELLDLEYSVDKAYRKNATFIMHDLTQKKIRQIVDTNGRPLWIAGGVSEGIQGRNPDTLLGYPTSINNDMAQMAAGAKSMIFGDLTKYKIRRVKQLQMIRFAERYMDSLQIGFLAFQRFDGNLIDASTGPVKLFKNSAS